MSEPVRGNNRNLDEETVISMKAYRNSKAAADEMLKKGDPDDIEKLLVKLEHKLKEIPKVGGVLSHVPVFISLIRSYVRKEYTTLPIVSAVGILTALIYFLSPVDMIPDAIPGVGLIDDAAVVAIVWTLVETDVENYQEWRSKKNRET